MNGFQRLLRATAFSLHGLRQAYASEAAFRLECYFCIFLVPAAFWLGKSGSDRAILIGSLLLVLVVELLNSGIEAVVDRFGTERHELSGMAKDVGSAAVFVALINVLVIWGLVIFA